jgi:hypothetical protein
MKQLALLLTIGLISLTFTGCEKATDDYKTLAGSKWEAKTENTTIVLHFVDENVCTIGTYGTSYSLNVTTYSYRLANSFDSMGGSFHIYQLEDGSHCYSGYFENKKINLEPTAEWITEYPSFQKQK